MYMQKYDRIIWQEIGIQYILSQACSKDLVNSCQKSALNNVNYNLCLSEHNLLLGLIFGKYTYMLAFIFYNIFSSLGAHFGLA